ncbi:hypothetical protein LSH36_58g11014 [Paralvinella palmiformis]|uniref:Uncharacterized protein n=1 Tax=Paralvinella palmiformis TaxID=53620 RepID=A0AAD9K4N8_9ANNE|nr:hypothetical protein LSH36_58g11014 [Paralvinella palmiformis]
MGCTPSIQVSQTGVVYCRDSDSSSNSPRHSSNSHGIFTQTVSTTVGVGGSTSSTKSSGSGKKVIRTTAITTIVDRRGPANISEAETQTGVSVMKVSWFCILFFV